MRTIKLKEIILKNLGKLEKTSYRGRVHTLKLWMEFAFSIKRGSDFQKLYTLHQSALELLIENKEVNNVDGKTISDSEFELAPKGRETLDKINRNLIEKLFYYFEPQIKSEVFKMSVWIVSVVASYLLGYFRIFKGR
ncbi:hypothetical protein HYS03_02885 [Candidatus Woesebacteria bacterium]|nr:hypothetical protein [Candidatus Woesebacteria bacterium]